VRARAPRYFDQGRLWAVRIAGADEAAELLRETKQHIFSA
jgi:hypothetical protein